MNTEFKSPTVMHQRCAIFINTFQSNSWILQDTWKQRQGCVPGYKYSYIPKKSKRKTAHYN